MIQVRNVTKEFKNQAVLENVTVQFEAGKIHGIIGKNGSGKTVFLRLLCGLMSPTSGTIIVDGKEIGKVVDFAPDAGIIIEPPSFLTYKSGYRNLKDLAAIRNKIQKGEVVRAMNQVGLDPFNKKRVGKYSLGMRQRLGIVQAIMEHPKLLILDIRVEQRICGKSKAVNQRIQNIKGRVGLAQFDSLDVPFPTVEIIGQILLGEM